MGQISENLRRIYENIGEAADKSGRKSSDITLVGVTKTIDTTRIKELLCLGVKNLGENRVQELLGKYPVLGEEPDWHLIGHLQTNKVKYVIDKVKLIHSVDSIKLAEEIDKQAAQRGILADILVEVNIGEEETKFGIRPDKVVEFSKGLSNLEHIQLCGLMTVAPYVEKPEKNRNNFEKMMELFIDMQVKCKDNKNIRYVSMGMTNDYEVAIEEGANIIRIGTGIFGNRQ